MKRVVTTIGDDGKSHIISDGQAPRIMRLAGLPGLEFAEMWATESATDLTDTPQDLTPAMSSLVPGETGTRFRIVTLPPDRAVAAALSDPARAMALIGELRD